MRGSLRDIRNNVTRTVVLAHSTTSGGGNRRLRHGAGFTSHCENFSKSPLQW